MQTFEGLHHSFSRALLGAHLPFVNSGQHSHVHGLSAGSRPSRNDQRMTETPSNEDRQWE